MQPAKSKLVLWTAFLFTGLFCALNCSAAVAQTPEPAAPGSRPAADRPHLDPFPAEQDWSFLADPVRRIDPYDRLKYLPWGSNTQHYVSLGFEERTEYEYFAAPANASGVRFLGDQGDMEIRWPPVSLMVTALNVAGFQPRGFLTQFPDHRTPVVVNLGVTYRF